MAIPQALAEWPNSGPLQPRQVIRWHFLVLTTMKVPFSKVMVDGKELKSDFWEDLRHRGFRKEYIPQSPP